MGVKGDLKQRLTTVGLTSDEARAYLCLIERGVLPARGLAAITGISTGRIYQVLEGLKKKGAASEVPGKVRSFQAIPAKAAMANLLASKKQELAVLDELALELVSNLSSVADNGDAAPLLETISHKATLDDRCERLIASATEEILWWRPGAGVKA